MMRAYPDDYMTGACRILGDAVDFAIMSLRVEPDVFGRAFAVSDSAKQFGNGNPRYVAGMNGCELARKVLSETQTPFEDADDAMYIDKSPEFWAGWALAFFQWYSGFSFMEILGVLSVDEIIAMYPVYHETDIMRFADRMYEIMRDKSLRTRLRIQRENCGFSQSELACAADVPIRQIQLFEQKKRNINKTSAETLKKLSVALYCSMEDLMEK